MKVVYRLFTSLAVYALLLPILGPALDHHFAERLPPHEHVYFGSVSLHHIHLYEMPHEHTPDGDSAAPPAGVLSVAAWEGQVAQPALVLLAGTGVLSFDLNAERPPFDLPRQAQRPADLALPPLEQPPRLSALPLA